MDLPEQIEADGRFVGLAWARDMAAPRQLDRLAELFANGDADAIFEATGERGPRGALTAVLNGADSDDHDLAFWRNIVGAEAVEITLKPEFLRGFAAGALAVWSELQAAGSGLSH